VILFPAIDLFGGDVVRLTKGDFSKRKDYGLSPLETAKNFLDAGCTHIHIVDLEGAKEGRPCHLEVLEQIASLGMFVQYGGGRPFGGQYKRRTLGWCRQGNDRKPPLQR